MLPFLQSIFGRRKRARRFRIEAGDAHEPIACACCGRLVHSLTRFVFDANDNAIAAYYATFTDGHPEQAIRLSIGLGDWGTDKPRNRRAFTIWYKNLGETYGFMVRDPEDNPWNSATVFGKYLTRTEALADAEIATIWALCDEIVVHDPEISGFLAEKGT
jgi:hypothetical protein